MKESSTEVRRPSAYLMLAVAALALTLLASQVALASLKLGDSGEAVKELQAALSALSLYSGPIDGYFGPQTRRSVISFQVSEGLLSDGVVGPGTQKRLASLSGAGTALPYVVQSGDTVWSIARRVGARPAEIIRLNELSDPGTLRPGQTLKVPQALAARRSIGGRPGEGADLVPWVEADKLFPRGARAYMVDVETGLGMWVRRIQGTYHADSEPLSSSDTQVLKRLYGGKWSWARRAVWVQLDGRYVAASINGYPHGREDIRDNGFAGHFCIHFLNSRLHTSGRADPDHQAMVLKAARSGRPSTSEQGDAPDALGDAGGSPGDPGEATVR